MRVGKPKKPPRIRDREAEREYTRRWRAKRPVAALLSQLKGNAHTRKRGVTLTLDQLEELVEPMRCSVTGVELFWDWDGEGNNPWAPSVDRIDCSRGYHLDNVRVVCWAYNIARRDWPDEVVRHWAKALTLG